MSRYKVPLACYLMSLSCYPPPLAVHAIKHGEPLGRTGTEAAVQYAKWPMPFGLKTKAQEHWAYVANNARPAFNVSKHQ